jgi:hypothetical protein
MEDDAIDKAVQTTIKLIHARNAVKITTIYWKQLHVDLTVPFRLSFLLTIAAKVKKETGLGVVVGECFKKDRKHDDLKHFCCHVVEAGDNVSKHKDTFPTGNCAYMTFRKITVPPALQLLKTLN